MALCEGGECVGLSQFLKYPDRMRDLNSKWELPAVPRKCFALN